MSSPVIPNHELVVYGLYLAGGATRRVHTEDVAIECWKFRPDAFSWTKHPEYPDKDIVRVALFDARKEKHGARVSGRVEGRSTSSLDELEGWTLTENGLNWVKKNESRFAGGKETDQKKVHRQKLLKQGAEYRARPLFGQYVKRPADFAPGIGELAAFFRCRVDANQLVWERRLQELRNIATSAEDLELQTFAVACNAAYESQS